MKNPGMTLHTVYRLARFDGDGGADDGKREDPPAKKPSVDQRVQEELEKRYKPRSVREWLAQYSDNAELALEKAVDMLNDRIQKQIKSETTLQMQAEELQEKLTAAQGELKTAREERDAFKGQIESAQAEARQAALVKALEKAHPETHTALRLALKEEGYTLEINDKDEVMVTKDDKRHQLKTVLTDDFYKRYPFAKAKDEKPFQGGGSRTDEGDLGESIAAEYGKLAATPKFDFGQKE